MSSMVRERWSYKTALVGLAISGGVAAYFAIRKYADRGKLGVGGGRPAHGSASQQQQLQVGRYFLFIHDSFFLSAVHL